MPNGWFDLTAEEIAILVKREAQRQIAEWKRAHPDVRLPYRLQSICKEEARNAEKRSA